MNSFCEDARNIGLHRLSGDEFTRCFDLMGVQRHLKAAGIFARLNHRDGKAAYMADVPRTLSYIVDLAPKYDELGFLVDLISTRCLPGLDVS
jgi:aminoglycoside/choline kinase family phosphotransferase